MGDITINNEENQNSNQKTTPVTESLSVLNNSSFSSPDGILQIWLELGYGNITFSDELDFDPADLDAIYESRHA